MSGSSQIISNQGNKKLVGDICHKASNIANNTSSALHIIRNFVRRGFLDAALQLTMDLRL